MADIFIDRQSFSLPDFSISSFSCFNLSICSSKTNMRSRRAHTSSRNGSEQSNARCAYADMHQLAVIREALPLLPQFVLALNYIIAAIHSAEAKVFANRVLSPESAVSGENIIIFNCALPFPALIFPSAPPMQTCARAERTLRRATGRNKVTLVVHMRICTNSPLSERLCLSCRNLF